MKWFFLLILIANIGYFAWELDREATIVRLSQSEKQAVAKDLETLKVLDENSEYPAQRLPQKVDTVSENPTIESTEETLRAFELRQMAETEGLLGIEQDEPYQEPVVDNICYRIGPFKSENDRRLIVNWMDKRNIESILHQTFDTSSHLYWVTLSPMKDISEASDKYNEIKSKGIKDIMIVREGDFTNAISLGIYSTQAAVNRRLLEMKSQGYQAVVVPRYNKSFEWVDVKVASGTENEIDFSVNPFLGKKYQKISCNQIALVERNP